MNRDITTTKAAQSGSTEAKTSQHTPGPWKFHRPHPETDTAALYIEVTGVNGGAFGDWSSSPIACLYSAPSGETQEANARLIAASPTMLEALKEANAVWSANRGRLIEANDTRGRMVEEAFIKVRSAIENAQGVQS